MMTGVWIATTSGIDGGNDGVTNDDKRSVRGPPHSDVERAQIRSRFPSRTCEHDTLALHRLAGPGRMGRRLARWRRGSQTEWRKDRKLDDRGQVQNAIAVQRVTCKRRC